MKTYFYRTLIVVALLAMGAASRAWAESISQAGYVPMRIHQTVQPEFPLSLMQSTVSHGEARVAVDIGPNGELEDYLVTGYTHPAFAREAVRAIKQWKFDPTQLNGQPTSSIVEITIRFAISGIQVVTLDMAHYAEERLAGLDANTYVFHVSKLSELDQIPVPVQVIAPAYPKEFADKGIKGSVAVEFYIDQTGKVRLPAVSRSSSPELSMLAVAAVRQWQFEAPTNHGQPTIVHVSQVFNFNPSDAK